MNPLTSFAQQHAKRTAVRRFRGLAFPTCDNVESTVFFRFLNPEQQEQIRRAACEEDARALLARFVDHA